MSIAVPLVTFVVPCHNYGRFLGGAIDSLLAQSVPELEIIVVDDASTDETADVALRYSADPRVRLVRHEQNLGHLRTYDHGLALARGAYVALLSADDICLDREAVAKQLALFERDREVGIVYSGHLILRPDGTTSTVLPWPVDRIRSTRDEFADLIWGNYITHSGTLLRVEVQRELGSYDPRLPHTGDWDMWLRAAARHRVGYVAQPLYGYRMHGGNMRHRRISPAQAAAESVLTLERGLAALRAADREPLAPVLGGAIAHALLQNAWFDLAEGLRIRSLRGLAFAVRHSPSVLARGEAWRLFARTLSSLLIGRRRYRRVDLWLDRRRGATARRVGASA